jgi:D-alanyl-D-alanine carboxypeptidase/D-alanyl-D-alanine-endopeptidase (penicillin-binding protein 4)
MKIRNWKLLAVAVVSMGFAGAASAKLAKQIDGIIKQPSQKKVRYSIAVVKADSGEVVYSHNAKEAMIPASNVKVITTTAALKYLGPNYKFKTEVGLCGNTLVIKGGGDPLLGDKVTDAKYGRKAGWIFEDIAERLKRNDVTTINDIVVDSSIFDDERVHPNWPRKDLNQRYACEVSGLNFNGNCIDMTIKTIGGDTTVFIEPETDYVKIINEVKPISQGKSAAGAYRSGEMNKLIVKGSCKKQVGPFAVAIERPAAFFGYLLAENLDGAGIRADGQLLEKSVDKDCKFEKIAEYNTSMKDCLARSNKDSLNLAAEALFKTIATGASGGKNGSWATGRELIHRYLLELGVDNKEFYVDDGSGLSRENKLSANAITKVLFDVYKGKNGEFYKSSLAIGGVDGIIIGRYFEEEKYKGKIFGKTGYISGVKSFSGICSTEGGDYIFSILANGTNGQTRGAINDIVKAIIDINKK